MSNETVETYNEIHENILTLKKYLNGSDEEKEYVRKRIQLGICFVVIREGNGHYEFYPSKFIGYKKNSLSDHENAEGRDGKVTKRVMIKILNEQPITIKDYKEHETYEKEYIRFCNKLGIEANPTGACNTQRKFWINSQNSFR